MPPSDVVGEQTTPSIWLHCAPPCGGWSQTPNVAVGGTLVQMPPQQSAGLEQMSPGCPQYEGAEHTPARQNAEQHCALVVHALPSVSQVVLRGVQVPPMPHVPLQHWAFVVHAWLSLVHGFG